MTKCNSQFVSISKNINQKEDIKKQLRDIDRVYNVDN